MKVKMAEDKINIEIKAMNFIVAIFFKVAESQDKK
jgi:hypothetical protein